MKGKLSLRSFEWFLLVFLGTAASSALAVSGEFRLFSAFALGLVYAAAIAAQLWISGSSHFERKEISSDGEDAELDGRLFYYCGTQLDRESDKIEEKIALREIRSPKKMLLRFVALAVIYGIYGYLLRRWNFQPLRFSHFFLLAGAGVVLFATSLGHFLIPVGLQFLAVAGTCAGSGGELSWRAVAYLYLFFATLIFYSVLEAEITHPQLGMESLLERQRRAWRTAAGLVVGVAVIVTFLHLVLPEEGKFKPAPRTRGWTQEPGFQKLNYALGERLEKLKTAAPAEQQAAPKPAVENGSPARSRPLSPEAVENALKILSNLKLESGSSNPEMRRQAQKNVERIRELAKSGSLDPETLTALLKDTEKKLGQIQPSGDQAQAEAEDIKAAEQALAQVEKALKENPDALPSPVASVLAQELSQGLPELSQAAEKGSGASGDSRFSMGGLANSASTAQAKPTARAPKPLLSDRTLERIASFLRFALYAVVLWVIYQFLERLLRKSDPAKLKEKPALRLTRDQRSELRAALREIDRARLSPAEEIIRKYHFFLQLMERLEHPRPEHLPPTEYSRELSRFFPWLSPSFHSITETFSDAFYGKLEVMDARVKEFRVNLELIVRQFV